MTREAWKEETRKEETPLLSEQRENLGQAKPILRSHWKVLPEIALRFQFYFPVPRFLRLYLRVRIRALRPHPPASKDRPKNKRSSGACDRPFRLLSEQATRRREKRGQLCFQSPECATRWVSLRPSRERRDGRSLVKKNVPSTKALFVADSLHVSAFTFHPSRFMLPVSHLTMPPRSFVS